MLMKGQSKADGNKHESQRLDRIRLTRWDQHPKAILFYLLQYFINILQQITFLSRLKEVLGRLNINQIFTGIIPRDNLIGPPFLQVVMLALVLSKLLRTAASRPQLFFFFPLPFFASRLLHTPLLHTDHVSGLLVSYLNPSCPWPRICPGARSVNAPPTAAPHLPEHHLQHSLTLTDQFW